MNDTGENSGAFCIDGTCIPAVSRRVLTWHILLTRIGYLCLIRRGKCNFSLIINKIIFMSCLQFPSVFTFYFSGQCWQK